MCGGFFFFFFVFFFFFFFAVDFIFNWDLIKGNFFFFLLKWGGLLVDWGVWLVGWFGVNNLGVFSWGVRCVFWGIFFFLFSYNWISSYVWVFLALIIEGHASQHTIWGLIDWLYMCCTSHSLHPSGDVNVIDEMAAKFRPYNARHLLTLSKEGP